MIYYPYSIKRLRILIKGRFPEAEPKRDVRDIPAHCLWMFSQLEKMPKSQSAKAGRWIGWIFGRLESLGLITNNDSKRFADIDNNNGDI